MNHLLDLLSIWLWDTSDRWFT